jgi:polygalacturonase
VERVLDRKQQEATNNYRDYGLVTRFTDGSTGKAAVIVAGSARGATIAAGEFLTESNNLEALAAKAPRHWDGKNIEVVISAEIIDGRSFSPSQN